MPGLRSCGARRPSPRIRSIRRLQLVGGGTAAAGPPHSLRSAAWVTPCGWPVRWFQAATRPLSSRRRVARCSWVETSRTHVLGRRARCAAAAWRARSAAGAAGRAPGRARAARGCRGSPSPPRSRRAPRPRGRTRRRRRAPGRSAPRSPAPRSEPSSSSLAPSAALACGEQLVLGGEDVALVVDLALEHVVALDLHLGGEAEQVRHRRQEHRRGLAAAPGPDEAADGLREEQRGRGAGRVDPDREPRHVDALGDHPDRDHPALRRPRRTPRSACEAAFSSESTTVGFSPVIVVSSAA